MENNKINKKIAIALSGGVDSAVSAYLLKKKYKDVVGVHAVCYKSDEEFCTSEQDRKDAIKIANQLDIPIKIIDLQKEYNDKVIQNLVFEYENNRTPNPDVLCNRDIKFDLIYDFALLHLKCDYFATGHYAKNIDGNLYIPKDKSKDQTYFLWMVKSANLNNVLFPLGDYLKSEVRQIALDNSLLNANKKDSTGICFVGNVGIKDFLKNKISSKQGVVYDIDGNKIGTHIGTGFYTIGQRHGFDINIKSPDSTKVYVYKKNIDSNSLVVACKEHLYTNKITIANLHFFTNLEDNKIYQVRIRNLGELINTTVKISKNQVNLTLKQNVFAVASGQSAVIYDNGKLICGGIIV